MSTFVKVHLIQKILDPPLCTYMHDFHQTGERVHDIIMNRVCSRYGRVHRRGPGVIFSRAIAITSGVMIPLVFVVVIRDHSSVAVKGLRNDAE